MTPHQAPEGHPSGDTPANPTEMIWRDVRLIKDALLGTYEKEGLVGRVHTLERKEANRAKREMGLWSALVGILGKMAFLSKGG